MKVMTDYEIPDGMHCYQTGCCGCQVWRKDSFT